MIRPQFLIGLYAVMENRSDLVDNTYMTDANVASCEPLFRELADAGFNTIQNYGTASGRVKQVQAYLDLADKYRLLVLMQLSGVEAMHYQAVEAQMRHHAHHPCVISWLLKDEGDMSGWSPVKARQMYDWMRSIDPARAVGMVVRDCTNYVNAVDLLLPAQYSLRSTPTPQHRLGNRLSQNQKAAQTAQTPTTAVALLQAFNYEDEFDKGNREGGRVPSFEEERCIAYLAIAAGQQGVMFYAYHSSATHLKQYPEHWSDLKRLAGELRDRSTIFLSQDTTSAATVSGEGIVSFTRRHAGSCYLFIVNPDVAEKDAKVQFDSTVRDATWLENDSSVSIESNVDIQIPAFGVQTYRLTIDDGT